MTFTGITQNEHGLRFKFMDFFICGGGITHFGVIKSGKLTILVFILILISHKGFSLGEADEEKWNLLKECVALCEKLNLTTEGCFAHFMNTTAKKYKACATVLNRNDKLEGLYEISDGGTNALNAESNNSTDSAIKNGICGNSTNNRVLERFQKLCELKEKQIKNLGRFFQCAKGNRKFGYNITNLSNFIKTVLNTTTKKFSITNEQPEYINISLNDTIRPGKFFLWYGSYANSTRPKFECMKIQRQNFTVHVTPNVNYLICLSKVTKYIQVNIFDCQPFKTKPPPGEQPWLVKKSIPILVMSIFILFILAMVTGAFILYLSVHKNPSLIRGSKRVIEVKRQDKAQILIMPRGYESLPQADSPLSLSVTNDVLRPAISTLSCDTISTVSYVSANQPTPVEILTYRLNKLKELLQKGNNNIPALISSIPRPFSMSLNQRLPAEIDLLFEYEWYTITTTITTTGAATEECVL